MGGATGLRGDDAAAGQSGAPEKQAIQQHGLDLLLNHTTSLNRHAAR